MKLLIWISVRFGAFFIECIKYTYFLIGYIKINDKNYTGNRIEVIDTEYMWFYGFDCYTELTFIIIFLIDPEFRQVAKDFVKYTIFRRPLSEAYIK